MTFFKRLGFALVTGYILFFYSERMFWSFMRPGDDIGGQIMAWLLYSVGAYLFLIAIERFRVNSVPALFLAGGIFGWLIEGVYAMTFFGGGGIPFPITFAWTALSWHALISVLIGWYYLHISLADRGYFHTLWFSSLLGLFWGVWAVAWALEAEPLYATPTGFLVHAFLTTFFLIISFALTRRFSPGAFASSRWERWVLLGAVVLFALAVTLPAVNVFFPALLLAFALALWPLHKNKKLEEKSLLAQFDKPIRAGKYLCLLAMPLVATLAYIGLNAAGLVFPSNIATFVISSLLGTFLFFQSMVKILRRKPIVTPAPAPASPTVPTHG